MGTMSQVTGDHAAVELNSRERQVVALRDRFPAATPDTDWIAALSQEGDWTVVTHDRLNKGAEREVLKRAAIKVFLLDKSWKHQAFWAKAENLVRWWPSIVEQAERIRGGAAFRVRWKFSGKGQFDQITL
jgi:hypothetical protein